MIALDAVAIRERLGEFAASRLDQFQVFDEIESTNSYLMQQPSPAPGRLRVALTDNQTAGRGRHGRTWLSPPGSGLCLSVGYTYARQPADFPALTLAIGLGVVEALDEAGAPGVLLKWPNDLVTDAGKLGGILTESRPLDAGPVMVVTGIGLNVDLRQSPGLGLGAERARPAVDLAGHAPALAPRSELAARLIDHVSARFAAFESDGFAALIVRWSQRDWLRGRELTVEKPGRRITGTAAGVAEDGALLVDTGAGSISRVTSGSVLMAGDKGYRT